MCYTKYTHRLRPNQYSFIGHLYRGNIVCIDCFYHTHKSLSSQCMLDLAKYLLGQTSDSSPQCKCLSSKVAKVNVWENSVLDFFSWQSMGMFTIGISSMADTADYQRTTMNITSSSLSRYQLSWAVSQLRNSRNWWMWLIWNFLDTQTFPFSLLRWKDILLPWMKWKGWDNETQSQWNGFLPDSNGNTVKLFKLFGNLDPLNLAHQPAILLSNMQFLMKSRSH